MCDIFAEMFPSFWPALVYTEAPFSSTLFTPCRSLLGPPTQSQHPAFFIHSLSLGSLLFRTKKPQDKPPCSACSFLLLPQTATLPCLLPFLRLASLAYSFFAAQRNMSFGKKDVFLWVFGSSIWLHELSLQTNEEWALHLKWLSSHSMVEPPSAVGQRDHWNEHKVVVFFSYLNSFGLCLSSMTPKLKGDKEEAISIPLPAIMISSWVKTEGINFWHILEISPASRHQPKMPLISHSTQCRQTKKKRWRLKAPRFLK